LSLVGILLMGWLILRSFGVLGLPLPARPREVPPGDQEVAFIQAATNNASWERFVTGIRRAQKQLPDLVIDDTNAFPDQSAVVPEVALSFPGSSSRLWLRWYKLTSDAGIEKWVEELGRRDPAPLALIGGGSSDRARDLALALARRQTWHGAPPLLFLTTATADSIFRSGPAQQSLMELYPGRTYRFCFTNSQMAEAIWDFVWSQDSLRPYTRTYPLLPSAIAQAAGDFPGSWHLLVWALAQPQPFLVHIVEWLDDPYSRDLANQFRTLFKDDGAYPLPNNSFTIPYSVGSLLTPNPREAMVLSQLIDTMPALPEARLLLILPGVDRPARRFLRALAMAAPQEVDKLVVVTGDSIPFNTLYRDRQIAWHIQELPVPLVSFCHQNPVDWDEDAPAVPGVAQTATDDEQLNADIVQVLVEAAFGHGPAVGPPSAAEPPVLLASADELNEQVKRRRAHYFAPDGNRRGGSGEYLVCLKPIVRQGRVLPRATLEVWARKLVEPGHVVWDRIKKLEVDYSGTRQEGLRGAS